MKVVLCICTCKRPVGLTRLLEGVAQLDFDDQLSVVVVDNDADGREGLAVCERMAPSYRWPLACVIEEQHGISFARNRAVAVALEQEPDFIAMLDDDERPCREWLRELLRVQTETDADVVGGPVVPEFPPDAAPWLIEGRFFEKATARHDGPRACLRSTCNFIARSCCFRPLLPAPFDPEFALSGGGDVAFFRQLAVRGFKTYLAAGAHVRETIPSSRANMRWLMRRALRHGNNEIKRQRLYDRGLANEVRSIYLTIRILTYGLLMSMISWQVRVMRARTTLILCRALGRMAGHFGVRYSEYRTIHGT